MNIIIDDSDHPLIIKVATLQPARMQVYFIDNEDYFLRGQSSKDLEIRLTPEDNDERIMFYVRGVVETVKKLRWDPTLVHASGWVSALAPIYLKRVYSDDPSFRNSKVVYSVFDDKFDGTLDPRMVEKLKMEGFTDEDLKSISSAPVDYVALNKLAIDYSDGVIQASPEIDPEILNYIKGGIRQAVPTLSRRNGIYRQVRRILQFALITIKQYTIHNENKKPIHCHADCSRSHQL